MNAPQLWRLKRHLQFVQWASDLLHHKLDQTQHWGCHTFESFAVIALARFAVIVFLNHRISSRFAGRIPVFLGWARLWFQQMDLSRSTLHACWMAQQVGHFECCVCPWPAYPELWKSWLKCMQLTFALLHFASCHHWVMHVFLNQMHALDIFIVFLSLQRHCLHWLTSS